MCLASRLSSTTSTISNLPTMIRRGFTLIEALVAITLTVAAGSALLYGVYDSIGNTKRALEQTIATGLAQQMMDEIAGLKYCEDYSHVYQWPLYRECGGTGRTRSVAVQRHRRLCGHSRTAADGSVEHSGGRWERQRRVAISKLSDRQLSDQLAREVDVYYVSNTDLTAALASGQTSNFRAVEVRYTSTIPMGRSGY